MFDIATVTAFDDLSRGAFLHLTHPSGAPIYDDAGQAVGVVLRGRNSMEGIEAARRVGNKRLSEARRPGGAQITVESNEAMNAEVLAVCTVSWTFDQIDGKSFPCNFQNALKFWQDERFRRWRNQAEEFIDSEANFTKS